jgi:hypothetical protein
VPQSRNCLQLSKRHTKPFRDLWPPIADHLIWNTLVAPDKVKKCLNNILYFKGLERDEVLALGVSIANDHDVAIPITVTRVR